MTRLVLPSIWFLASFIVLVLQVSVWLPRHWNGERRGMDLRFHRYDRGPDVFAAVRRLMPCSVLSVVASLSWSAAAVWSAARGAGAGVDVVSVALWMAGFLVFIVFSLSALAVFCFNQPKWMVAPSHRGDRGVLQG
ncbi:hypothetical protein LX16_3248 [Stackebrandtia albiflava]|uniref:Uncharacterized protein n=1 Tax=Stackebrandtia albiflava TaxID=406432 RepID=A0A562V3M5_9ACTN|nr:hypothetical protein [Stackebrandtia albiflava]TWJ12490.1 hypothetical protein LX16_3248 [Stackebrandtia albiflava]